MKVLILEDNLERIEIFKRNLYGLDLVISEFVQEIKNLLQNDDWDVLFLDHDLGGEVYVDTNREDTGSEIARYLNQNPDRQPRTIIIHSLNENGAINIKSLVRKSVILPFSSVQVIKEQLENSEFHVALNKLSEIQNNRLFGGV